MTEKQSKSDMQERRKETGQEYCKSEHGKGGTGVTQDMKEAGQDRNRTRCMQDYAGQDVCGKDCMQDMIDAGQDRCK